MKRDMAFFLTVLSVILSGCASNHFSDAKVERRSLFRRNVTSTAKAWSFSDKVQDGVEDETASIAPLQPDLVDCHDDDLQSSIQPASFEDGDIPPQPTEETSQSTMSVGLSPRSNYETLPIDTRTVLRLVNSNSPIIGFSQARVEEAQARAEAADLLWIPNLTAGIAYNRFDGQTQNQRGEIFEKSRSNLFANGGVTLNLDLADAIYQRLIQRRVAFAEEQHANSVSIVAQLDAMLAYIDLMQTEGLLEINAQVLEKGEAMLTAAQDAQRAKLDRSPGDVNRVRTEILLRRQERLDLVGRSNVASTRLGRQLLLRSSVKLVPNPAEIVPVTLVSFEPSGLDDLVATAIQNRPDLASSRELLGAAWERVRKAQRGPLLPKLLVTDQGGSFGGGLNADMGDFKSRNVVTGVLYWELKNLGFGNYLETIQREAGATQARFQLIETQARVAAEVAEAAQIAEAKAQMLEIAEEAVKEATELYRISHEGTFHVVDAKNLFDALRPLQSLQVLQQTRQNYLAAMMDHNRAQYRLYAAIGCPIE